MIVEQIRKNRDGLETSDHWATPKWLYDILDVEFHFDFDPCPINHNIDLWDGLKIEWGKSNYCNPPYNRDDKPKWIIKSYEEYQKGNTVVMLLPAATGTKQFHQILSKDALLVTWSDWLKNKEYYSTYNLVIFMEGRIAFEGYNTKGEYSTKNKGKHDSMIVVLRSEQSSLFRA